MFARHLVSKKLTRLIAAASLFLCLLALSPSVSAVDLNSKHDLCTGSNLSVQKEGAGCGKIEDPNNPGKFIDAKDQDAEPRFNKLLRDFLNLVSVIVGFIAVVMVIYGGFRILTSGGNPENTKAGRNAILYALIGLIVVAFAQLIVKFVLNKIA